MNIDTQFVGKTARMAFAVSGLLLTTVSMAFAGTHDIQPMTLKSVTVSTPAQAGVIVKLGEASLEEYQNGDPANRVQLLSTHPSAHQSVAVMPCKCRN